MCPHRWRMPKCTPDQLLFWRIGEMLFSAHHMSNGHQDVINHVCQQEHRSSIPAQQHKILNGAVVEFNATAHKVINDGYTFWNSEPQYVARPRAESTIARVTVISGLAVCFGALLDLLRCQIAVVGVTLLVQTVGSRNMLLRIL